MRYKAILVLVAMWAGAAARAEDSLFLVRFATNADGAALLSRGVRVVETRGRFALALGPPGGAAKLAGFSYEELGPPPGAVYLAWPRPGEKLPPAAGVVVLARVDGTYIISGPPGAVEALATVGVELKFIPPRGVSAGRAAALPPVGYDPLVELAVSRVDADRYFGFIEDLAAISSRYSHSPYIEEATSYIEDEFRSLGYQTERRSYSYDPGTWDVLLDCVFRDGGRLGWLASQWGYVWRTTDYGQSWTAVNCQGRPNELAFTSDTTGFVVGGENFMARTDDGGSSWVQLGLADPDDYLYNVAFVGATGVAVGDRGAVYRTGDGGSSWTKVASPTATKLVGLGARDAGRWWAVGDAGTALRSDDGGQTWVVVDIPAAGGNTLRDLAYADASHVVIVGYDGLILYSSDGGASWTRVSGSYPQWPYFTEVGFADATRGWAVGGDGKVFVTNDAGASWAEQPTPLEPADTLEAVSVLDRDRVWAAGYFSVLAYTADGGSSWTRKPLANSQPATWYNVEAVKPGAAAAGEIYILCGHYDCISEDPYVRAPGAEDNASGTACVLEAAAALADFNFEATLRFVTFSGEEQGLLGSRAYAEEEKAAGADIRAALNADMIAYADEPARDVEIRYGTFSQDLRAAYEDAGKLYVPELAVYAVPDGVGGSDHESFWGEGYHALMSGEHAGVEFYPYYHSTQDLPEYLDAELGAMVVKVNVATAASLARPISGPPAPRSRAVVFPNPARPGRGHDHIRFAYLAAGATVRLYDLAGAEVWSAAVPAAGYADWPLTSAGGGEAASGVYVYVVTDPDGRRVRGKVALIK